MARNFQDSIEELAEESGLDKITDEVRSIRDFRLDEEIENTIDPGGELREGIDAKLEDTEIEERGAEGLPEKVSQSPEPAPGAADGDQVKSESVAPENKAETDKAEPSAGDKT